MPTVLSAFTGLGGLDLGLERAGFTTIGCVERNCHARLSIEKNRSHWNLLEIGDIAEAAQSLKPSAVCVRRRQLGVLAGGPPCQPFSKAAQWRSASRAGLADARADALGAFLDLVEVFLPRIILIENVVGFVRGRTSALSTIESRLKHINTRNKTAYNLQWRTLNSVEYGVPQQRYRAIIFSSRKGEQFTWPEPTHKHRPVRAWDALHDLTQQDGLPEPGGYWSGLLPSIPEGHNYLHHTAEGNGKDIFGVRTRFWSFLLKLAKDQPSWTIPANPGPSTGPFHWSNRPLTCEERLRLQSFPRSWKAEGPVGQRNLQVGNATPPLLAEIIAREIGRQFFGLKYAERPTLSIARTRCIPPPESIRPVPHKYHKHIGKHAPHPGEGKGPAPRQPPPESP